MSEGKDDRVDFEFVRDAIENNDQEKMEIVAKDFIRWMKESDEHCGVMEEMVATSGLSLEEVENYILEQVVAKAADHKSVQETLGKLGAKAFIANANQKRNFKKFQDDNQ